MRAQPKRPLQAAGSGSSSRHPGSRSGAWTGARRDRDCACGYTVATRGGDATGERPYEIRRSADLVVPASCHRKGVVTTLARRAVLGPAASFGCSLGCRARRDVEVMGGGAHATTQQPRHEQSGAA